MREIIILLVIFILTIFFIIWSPKIKIRRKEIRLDYGIIPIISLILLWIFGLLNKQVFIDSMMGTNNLIPWQIIIIFFAVAYSTLSIDATGILEYFAFKILKWSKGNGKFLFFGLIGLTALMTIFTSNDIVILSLTPIIFYIGKHSKINPWILLITVFFMANSWSMFFYIDNPTDIMVAQAFGFGFLEYAKLMFFPTLVAGISTVLLCFFFFKKEIPKKIFVGKKINPKDFIRSKIYSIIGICLLILMFILLFLSDNFEFEIWKITLIFAGIFICLNLYFGFKHKTNQKTNQYQQAKTRHIRGNQEKKLKINEFTMVLHRYPYKIFPLIVTLFVIVHLFTIYGITDVIAKILSLVPGIFSGTIFISFLSAITSNIMINQPMTLLFANAMQSPLYTIIGSAKLSHGLGLIIGSNLGGNLTMYGALAGLMWVRILKNKGIRVSLRKFITYSLKIIPIVILLSAITLAIKIKFLY